MLRIGTPWDRLPQFAEPAAGRVVACYTPFLSGAFSLNGAPTIITTPEGAALSSASLSNNYEKTISGTTDNKTYVFVGKIAGSTGMGLGGLHTGGTYAGMLYVAGGQSVNLYFKSGASLNTSAPIVTNKRFVAVGSYNGAVTRLGVRLIGEAGFALVSGTGAGSSSFSTFRAGPLFGNSRVDTNLFAVLSYAASAGEIESLLLDPWQLFAPQTIWVPVSAGTPSTFQPAWARNANTILQVA